VISGALFAVVTITYWCLQSATTFFSRRYYAQVAFLLAIGVLGFWFSLSVFGQPSSFSLATELLALVVGAVALASLVLGLVKLFWMPGGQVRTVHSLERSLAYFVSPTRRLKLETEDGVSIQVEHLMEEPRRDKVIVVCHGGGRNKDIYANVVTCELLFEDYDVITFDFRGHQESGGKWAGDGRTKHDLKAVIDYAQQLGYQKVGVVGWSFGAWTAVMEVAEYQNVDTVVAAAPPPTDFREVEMAKPLFRWGFRPWALPARMVVTVLRNVKASKYDQHPSLMDFVGRVSPIPLLIVCNEYDRAIGLPVERFEQLYDEAQEPKRLAVLKGSGHVFDWPNTYHFLTLMREWLAETMS
jgi:pimeloyl-ACP methyl ester carboxylesterase